MFIVGTFITVNHLMFPNGIVIVCLVAVLILRMSEQSKMSEQLQIKEQLMGNVKLSEKNNILVSRR